MLLEIRGTNLPGRRCGPNPQGEMYENVHVGVGDRNTPIELVPGDAPSANWRLERTVRFGVDGSPDFRGPFVKGKRGERCLYLYWGAVSDAATFQLFRAAKLRLSDINPDLVQQALLPGRRLVGSLGLTDRKGHPLCASVRPPAIAWSVA